ncbi:Metallo-dependent hydrolase [Ganoderma leucocontextum]|nr:Metallo-dependent hydrolase [Ganoderma leucocontextum]
MAFEPIQAIPEMLNKERADDLKRRRKVLIQGDFVQTPALGKLEIFPNYLLRTDGSGIIDHFANATHPTSLAILRTPGQNPELHMNGSFILPTFCDLHLHAPQFLYQGTGLHLPLMQWLDEYAFKAEERLDADPKLAERVYEKLAHKLIEHGTGAVLLFGTIKTETNLILARAMQHAGLRAFVGKLSMDVSSRPSYKEASAEAALEAVQDFCHGCREWARKVDDLCLVEPVLTPRFVPTCSNELLSGLGKLAGENDLRIQSHMAESYDQVEWVRAERKAEDMDVFAQHNLLTPRTVQAHCTFLSPSDLSTLANTGAAIAHCPLSNAYFSAEPFRLREALDAGVPVGLGTDIAGGYSIDIMNAMRQAVIVSRMREGTRVMASKADPASTGSTSKNEDGPLSIDWKEALYLATTGGAAALGLPKGSGTFAVGVPFDAQSIELYRESKEGVVRLITFFDDPSPQVLTEDLVEKWWCLGDFRNRRGMWVQGRRVEIPREVQTI